MKKNSGPNKFKKNIHIALFEPVIPQNTGNIIRLCANSGAQLHLIGQLGFELSDKNLRRSGLDYHEYVSIQTHKNFDDFLDWSQNKRIFAISTKGRMVYSDVTYQSDDILLFGAETTGLPESIQKQIPHNQQLRIPMLAHSRSLNLANAVSVVCYTAWQQFGFEGGC